MSKYNSLLVGVDFTPCSAAALRQGLRLATSSRAGIRAVHVIEKLVAVELEEALSEQLGKIREGLLSDARKAWSEFAAAAPGAAAIPFDATIHNRTSGLVQAVRDGGADLLVIGAFGQSPVHVGLGTIATACVRNALCDVLIVREAQTGPFKTIVAGVDFSDTSALALQRAAEIAQMDKADLRMIHVFDPPWHRLHYRAPTVEATPQFKKQYRDGLSRRLEDFARSKLLSSQSPAFMSELLDESSHRNGIVAYAQQVGADLIVLGARGRSNVRDMLLGSTAEKVLRNTKCSVLAVKPGNLAHG